VNCLKVDEAKVGKKRIPTAIRAKSCNVVVQMGQPILLSISKLKDKRKKISIFYCHE